MLKSKVFISLFFFAINLSAATKEVNNDTGQPVSNKQQSGWFYGLFSELESSPYKGVSNPSQVLPAVGYKGELFSLIGPEASYKIYVSDRLNASLAVQYRSAGFEAQDSGFFTGMSKRQNSVFGGLALSYKPNRWTYQLSYLSDLQGRSKGSDVELSASYFKSIGPIFFTPSIGINYFDRHYTAYYYGVRPEESSEGRASYQGSSALNKSIGFTLATPILFKGFTRLSVIQNFLDNSITNSPLINNKRYWNINFSFTRYFSSH